MFKKITKTRLALIVLIGIIVVFTVIFIQRKRELSKVQAANNINLVKNEIVFRGDIVEDDVRDDGCEVFEVKTSTVFRCSMVGIKAFLNSGDLRTDIINADKILQSKGWRLDSSTNPEPVSERIFGGPIWINYYKSSAYARIILFSMRKTEFLSGSLQFAPYDVLDNLNTKLSNNSEYIVGISIYSNYNEPLY